MYVFLYDLLVIAVGHTVNLLSRLPTLFYDRPVRVIVLIVFVRHHLKSSQIHYTELCSSCIIIHLVIHLSTWRLNEYNHQFPPFRCKTNVKKMIHTSHFYYAFKLHMSRRYRLAYLSNKIRYTFRTKETPFFGYTIAGTNKEEKLKWVAALCVGRYPDVDLLMPVSLLK